MKKTENFDNKLIHDILPSCMNRYIKPGTCSYILHCRDIPSLYFLIILCIISTVIIPVSAAENQSFTCGVILPLSGDLNASGTALLQGIEMATDEINKNGGAAGYQIALRINDDEGSSAKALSLFKEMQSDGVTVVIGSYTTNLTLPMAEETKYSEDMILISPRANGEPLYEISPRFYQMNAPSHDVTTFVSDWLSYTAQRVAIIYIDDEYGRSILSGITSGLLHSPVIITGTLPVPLENSDFSSLFKTLLNDAPDALVISVYDSRQIPIIRNLSDAGFRGQVILTETGFIDTLESEESEVLSKFSLFLLPSNSYLVPGERTDQFIESFQDRYSGDPQRTIAGYGYDSMMVLAYAIQLSSANGNVTAQSIQKGLNESRYYGITGPKTFDSHHTVPPVLDRWIFKDGRFSLLSTSLT